MPVLATEATSNDVNEQQTSVQLKDVKDESDSSSSEESGNEGEKESEEVKQSHPLAEAAGIDEELQSKQKQTRAEKKLEKQLLNLVYVQYKEFFVLLLENLKIFYLLFKNLMFIKVQHQILISFLVKLKLKIFHKEHKLLLLINLKILDKIHHQVIKHRMIKHQLI